MSVNYFNGDIFLSDDALNKSTSGYFFGSSGDTFRLQTKRTISSPTDTGYVGEFCFGTSLGITYLYYCTATNTWLRVPLLPWII